MSTKLLPLLVTLVLVQSMALVVVPAGVEPPEPEDHPIVRWTVEVADSTNGTGRESTLALDSQDRPHMAHFDYWNVSLRYTTKVGESWATEVVDDSDLVGEYPSIAVDSQDRVHISYGPRQPLLHIPEEPPPPEPMIKALRYAVKTDSGWEKHIIWGPWAGYTSLALDPDDQPHISYASQGTGAVYYATREGAGWRHEEVDPEGFLDNAIAVDSEGNPHIAYARYAYGCMELYYAKWNGSAWEKEMIGLGGVILTDLALAIDEFDRRHLVWDGKDGMRYAIWNGSWVIQEIGPFHTSVLAMTLQGNSPRMFYQFSQDKYGVFEEGAWEWETINTTEKTGVGTASHPLAIDGSGVPHLSAMGVFGWKVCLVYVTRNPLSAGPVADAGPDQTVYEGDVVQFNGSGEPSSYTSWAAGRNIKVTNSTEFYTGCNYGCTLDSVTAQDGTLHVIWSELMEIAPSRYSSLLYYAFSNDSLTFSDSRSVLPKDWSGVHVALAVDFSGRVHVAFDGRSPEKPLGETHVYYTASEDGGLHFCTPVYVGEGSDPEIQLDEDGMVHIAFMNSEWPDSSGVYWTASTESFVFPPPKLLSVSDDYVALPIPSLVVDSSGSILVAWTEVYDPAMPGYPGYQVWFSRSTDNGSTFESVAVVNRSREVGYNAHLMIDSNGNPRIGWLVGYTGTSYPGLDDRNCSLGLIESTNGGIDFQQERISPFGDFRCPSMCYATHISLAVGSRDQTHGVLMAYLENETGDKEFGVYHFVRNEDGTISKMLKVNDDSTGNRRDSPSIDIAFPDRIDVFWRDNRYHENIYYSEIGPVNLGNLTFTWDMNDYVDSDGNGNSTDDVDATGPTPTWIYGDNGDFTVTLKVTDEGGNWDTDTMNVTVLNVAPEAIANHTCTGGGPADILFRIAGEKWHDVTFVVLEDGSEIFNETLVRMPGSPNEQMIGLEGFAMNGSRSYSIVAYYTPEDDPVNGQVWGATPAWVILRSGGNETARLHHTFNVRHPETWLWRVDDLESYLPERECTFTAYATDPGSDDLVFEWDFGDRTIVEHVYYNDGVGPDPYPSPEINPANAADEAKHSYASAGSYTVMLTVTDDDGGVSQVTLAVVL